MIARRIIGVLLVLFSAYIVYETIKFGMVDWFTFLFLLIVPTWLAYHLLSYDTPKAKEQRAIKQKEEEDKKNDKKSVFKTTD